MPLPDIPVDLWLQDQQELFRSSADRQLDALDFSRDTGEAITAIPPDVGGLGWEPIEEQQRQEAARVKEEADAAEARAAEAAQQAAQQELQRQLEAQRQEALDYGQLSNQNGSSPADQGAGPQVPSGGAGDLPGYGDDARAFAQGADQLFEQHFGEPPSEADQFRAQANGLIEQHFGLPGQIEGSLPEMPGIRNWGQEGVSNQPPANPLINADSTGEPGTTLDTVRPKPSLVNENDPMKGLWGGSDTGQSAADGSIPPSPVDYRRDWDSRRSDTIDYTGQRQIEDARQALGPTAEQPLSATTEAPAYDPSTEGATPSSYDRPQTGEEVIPPQVPSGVGSPYAADAMGEPDPNRFNDGVPTQTEALGRQIASGGPSGPREAPRLAPTPEEQAQREADSAASPVKRVLNTIGDTIGDWTGITEQVARRDRMSEIETQARNDGYRMGPLERQWEQDHPDESAEYNHLLEESEKFALISSPAGDPSKLIGKAAGAARRALGYGEKAAGEAAGQVAEEAATVFRPGERVVDPNGAALEVVSHEGDVVRVKNEAGREYSVGTDALEADAAGAGGRNGTGEPPVGTGDVPPVNNVQPPEGRRPGFGSYTAEPEVEGILNRRAADDAQYAQSAGKGGVSRADVRAAGEMFSDDELLKFADQMNATDTTEAAQMASRLTHEAQGAVQRGVDLRRELAALSDSGGAGAPAEQQRSALQALIAAADARAERLAPAARRYNEQNARAVGQLADHMDVADAAILGQKAESVVKVVQEGEKILERAARKGGALTEKDLTKLEEAAGQMEKNGHVLEGNPDLDSGVARDRSRRNGTPADPAEATPTPKDSTTLQDLARRLGEVEQEHVNAHGMDEGVTAAIDGRRQAILEQIRIEVMDRQIKSAAKPIKAMTEEELTAKVNEALGKRTVNKLTVEAAEQVGRRPDPVKEIVAAIRDAEKVGVQADRDAARELIEWLRVFPDEPETIRAFDALMQRIREHPQGGEQMAASMEVERLHKLAIDAGNRYAKVNGNNPTLKTDLELRLSDLAAHSDIGATRANNLTKGIEDRFAQKLEGFRNREISAAERKAAAAERQGIKAESRAGEVAANKAARELEQGALADQAQKVRDLVALARRNPREPRVLDGIQQLLDEMSVMGEKGGERAGTLRRQIYERNAVRAIGKEADPAKRAELAANLASLDPNDPQQIGKFIQSMSAPNWLQKLSSYRYVNLLSSPLTWGVTGMNTIGNTGMALWQLGPDLIARAAYGSTVGRATDVARRLAGRESVGNYTTLSEIPAAWRGAAGALGEARQQWRGVMAGDIPKTTLRQITELGDTGGARREVLTEQFEPPAWLKEQVGRASPLFNLGNWMHIFSTRPLEAMDAFTTAVMQGAGAERLASAKAARTGVSAADILSNIWEHPEIVDRMGKEANYVLKRWMPELPPEKAIQALVATRTPKPGAGIAEQGFAVLGQAVLPFAGVPIESARQGFMDRSPAGAFAQLGKWVYAVSKGNRQAEETAFVKMTAGVATSLMAMDLMNRDMLAGDGPSDPTKRALWAETHQRNSAWVPGLNKWVSWENTEMAMPLAMLANTAENLQEAMEKQGQSFRSPGAALMSYFGRAVTGQATNDEHAAFLNGAWTGMASGAVHNSFTQNFADIYDSMQARSGTGPQATAAGLVSSMIPMGGLFNWWARIGDSQERESKTFGEKLSMRVPGFRETVPTRLRVTGEPIANQQQGILAGLAPGRPSTPPGANDPLIRAFEDAGLSIGKPDAKLKDVELSRAEQRRLQTLTGEHLRQMTGKLAEDPRFQGEPLWVRQKMLGQMLSRAREFSQAQFMSESGGAFAQRQAEAARQKVAR